MDQAKKQKITESVREVFAKINLDYENFPPQIVPLYQMLAEYPLMVVELPSNKKLSKKSAVQYLEMEVGFEMPELQDDDRKLSGFLYTAKFGDFMQGCVFTDKNEPTVRRRFSAAHEFGHYLLHFMPLLKSSRTENLFLTESMALNDSDEIQAEIEIAEEFDFKTIGVENKYEMELEADYFAAELLMPRKACLQAGQVLQWKPGKNQKALINNLATLFLVSFGAMKRRLEDLSVLETE